MAEQTTTTKQAAVWKPPRLRILGLAVDTKSGNDPTKMGGTWEGLTNPTAPPDANSSSAGYRMPNSGEPVPYPYPWQ